MRLFRLNKFLKQLIIPSATFLVFEVTTFASDQGQLGEESWEELSDMDLDSNQTELITMYSSDEDPVSVSIKICTPQQKKSNFSEPGFCPENLDSGCLENKSGDKESTDVSPKQTLSIPVINLQQSPILAPILVNKSEEKLIPKLSLNSYKKELKILKKEKVYCDCEIPKCIIL